MGQGDNKEEAMRTRRVIFGLCGVMGWLALTAGALAGAEEPKKEPEVCKTCPKKGTEQCPGPEDCDHVKNAAKANLCAKCGEVKGCEKCCKAEGREICKKCGMFLNSTACKTSCACSEKPSSEKNAPAKKPAKAPPPN